MALPSGTKLGPYETQSLLGAGGMGEVYRARDTRLGREVALKILPSHLSSHPDSKERFDREARAISSLNHPRICTLHDVGHQDGVDFLVMEYLEGQTLADRLKKGPLPLHETLRVGAEICEALDVAHRAGFTHRDLKPANVMLTKSGAKLMDFGLAKAAVEVAQGNSPALLLSAARTLTNASPISPLTTAGAVVGTIQYMSPEQIEGKPADARSDLFALGAVLYECATAKRAFEGQSQISVASAILEKNPQPISIVQPVTPPAFERVVAACLEKNPDDRFQSARDVRLELRWIAEAGPAPANSPATARAQASAGPLRFLPWAAAGLLALVAAYGFFLAGRGTPPPRFLPVSYRQGRLQAARFSRDGQTIVYSGEWEGQRPEVSVARVGNPESRPLGISSATLGSLSSSDELALLMNCEPLFLIDCGGTLATVSLDGGAPRQIAEHVDFADWDPGGNQLLISTWSSNGARLEYPPGHVIIQQKSGWFGHPRFSPDGKWIAYENHLQRANDVGSVEVTDLTGNRTVLSASEISLEGLAWSPDGKEVWYAGTRTQGWADMLMAVSLSGRKREIFTLPNMRLHDVSRDGRVLVSRESWRRQLIGFFPGDKTEHAYSWLDDTNLVAMSSDAKAISFVESGEVYSLANDYRGYYRLTDGSPAVLLGAGAPVVAPDGKRFLMYTSQSARLQVLPIGPGDAKTLPTPGLKDFHDMAWSDDGRTIAYEGLTDQGEWNVYTQKVDAGLPALVMKYGEDALPTLSADGTMVAVQLPRQGVTIFKSGSTQGAPVRASLATEVPERFFNGGKSLMVGDFTGHDIILTAIDLASGRRQLWRDVPTTARSSGSFHFLFTPDLKYYAYSEPSYASDLYLVSNVH
jgi:eukaryotic-like serine/threonine-protein kinase